MGKEWIQFPNVWLANAPIFNNQFIKKNNVHWTAKNKRDDVKKLKDTDRLRAEY